MASNPKPLDLSVHITVDEKIPFEQRKTAVENIAVGICSYFRNMDGRDRVKSATVSVVVEGEGYQVEFSREDLEGQ